jgi:hypothetical protein
MMSCFEMGSKKKKKGEFVEMTNVVDSQLVAGMNKDLCCNNSNNRVGTVQIFITRLQQVMKWEITWCLFTLQLGYALRG